MYRISPFGHWFQVTDIFGNGDNGNASGKPVMTAKAAEMAFRLASKAAGAKAEKAKSEKASKANGVKNEKTKPIPDSQPTPSEKR